MQTRKFIWNFFLAIVFGFGAVVYAIYDGSGLKFWFVFIVLILFLSQSIRHIEETFRDNNHK